MYKIELSQEAEKQFTKLEKELQKRIINSLNRIMVDPFKHVERLVGLSYYKLRVGDYRLILAIKTTESVILISKIGHRKNIYS